MAYINRDIPPGGFSRIFPKKIDTRTFTEKLVKPIVALWPLWLLIIVLLAFPYLVRML